MSPERLLSQAEIAAGLRALRGWSSVMEDGRECAITRTFKAPSARGALDMIQQIGALAEAADHHPRLVWEFDVLTLSLSTHDAGGVTALDLSLAASINALIDPSPSSREGGL